MPKISRKMDRRNGPLDTVLDLMGEAGVLKSVRRSGWWMIGIKNGESVADHCFRTALLAYMLAKMEKIDPYPAVMMGLLNDLHETRINDLHKVGHRYIDFRAAERRASEEQLAPLPPAVRKEMTAWMDGLTAQNSAASLVARDADLLECMIQGKEYADQGNPRAIEWVTRPAHLLKTKSGKTMGKRLLRWESARWWNELVTLAR